MSEIQVLLHDHLFEQAPIMIGVLDHTYEIVEANTTFAKVFGDWKGRHCYEIMKNRSEPCERCIAALTFADGKVRVCDDKLNLGTNVASHFVVRVSPLASEEIIANPYLIWMASNVNEASSLQRENELLFERVPCYVAVLDRNLEVVRANRRMRETFGRAWGKHCYEVYKRRDRPCRQCPAVKVFEDGKEHTSTQIGVTATGEETHYVVTASPLTWEHDSDKSRVNFVIEIATDITQLKALEREKLDAERLAAVGQTVAGLAHGIKNILMGIEGGIYVMESGLKQDQAPRVDRGIQMLRRNVEKISDLVKNLLSFSKGHVPVVTMTDPNAVAREILDLYTGMSRKVNVELSADLHEPLEPAPLDAQGIHTCLANLVSNAIDACQASDKPECRVVLKTYERRGTLVYEVTDNGCGMDYEVKNKIFTTFFTTKGTGGTGLGLLTTRKIIQEHGGRILVESVPGQGTTFRILLPRDRLPRLSEPAEGESDSGAGGR